MKLTKRSIEAITPDTRKHVLAWDTELTGLGLRVTANGVRSYVLHYRRGSRRVRMTLGKHGALTPEQARRKARELLGAVASGGDPQAEARAQREGETVQALAERYLREHALPKKKPSSVASDRRLLARHILPAFASMRVADVTRADVARLHHALRETPYEANHTLAALSKMMNLAERWGLRADGSNPCRHVERFREYKRERFLSAAEAARLADALAALEHDGRISSDVAGAIRLLMLTGARRGEVCLLKWEHVDFERACLRLPDSKTGAKVIALSAPALALLSKHPRRSEWCFATERGDTPLDLSRTWDRIRDRAGLPGVRIHDLRHTFASVLAARGESLLVIGRILGHKVPATTARYAHLSDDPVRAATERGAAAVARAFEPRTPATEPAQPVPLRATG